MQYHSILNMLLLLSYCQVHLLLQVECQNYIRVLLVNKTEVITCGTNAFQPLCITREVSIYQLNKLPKLELYQSVCVIHTVSSSQAGTWAECWRGWTESPAAPMTPVIIRRLLWPKAESCMPLRSSISPAGPCHLPQPRRNAASADRPVQLQMA